jgi:DNA-binding transcriptional MerR regulator
MYKTNLIFIHLCLINLIMSFKLIQKIFIDKYFEVIQESSFAEISQILTEKTFSPKNLGISYRELNHWSAKGLLFDEGEFGKMRRFNLFELFWIELVKELRRYNLSLPTIKELKENLNSTVSIGEIFDENQSTFLDVMRQQNEIAFDQDPESAIDPAEYEVNVNDPDFMEELQKMKINLFHMLVFQVYILKVDINLLINPNGLWTVSCRLIHDIIIESDYYTEEFQTSHISISIGSLLSNIFDDYTPVKLNLYWKLINASEQKVLDTLRGQSNIKSVTVRFNEKSEIDLLEYTETLKVSPNDYLRKLMITGGYERIEVKTQKGNVVHCERTVKYKL